MISLKELLSGNDYNSLPKDHQQNIMDLLEKINRVRTAWNKPMGITSGYRSKQHHIEVYKNLAIQRGKSFNINQVPMGSNHLKGAAVDINDPDGSLYKWCQDNTVLLEQIGLWMEVKDDQLRVHFQIFPPKSGDRFFKP